MPDSSPDSWTTVASKHTRRRRQRQRALHETLLQCLSAPVRSPAAASRGARALCRHGDDCPYLKAGTCLFIHKKPDTPATTRHRKEREIKRRGVKRREMKRRATQSRAQLARNAAARRGGAAGAGATAGAAPPAPLQFTWDDRVALSPQAEKDYLLLSPQLQRAAHRIVADVMRNPQTKSVSLYQTKLKNPEHVQHGWLNRGARIILKVHHSATSMWVEIVRFTRKGKHDKVQSRVVQQYTLARQEERRCFGTHLGKHQNLLARKPSWLDDSASEATTCSVQSFDDSVQFD
jgi:hypothetical protein